MDINALEDAISAELERFGVPGCGIAIVKDGEVVLARGFGKRDVENDLAVTDQTLFPIGSSSKAFTASLVATLVDEGRFDWDTPVAELLPGFKMYDPVATLQLTPRDMLCHRSGLPRHDILWYNNDELTRAEVVARLRHLQPNKPFRQAWQYNNLLYITAGHLAEHFLGCSWEDGVRQRLLEPLGMKNTNFSVTESAQSDDHSLPYNEKDGVTAAIPLRGLDLAGPAGSINSCVADMTRWALLNVGSGEVDGTRVLSEAAMKDLHRPTMVLEDQLSAIAGIYDETYLTAYALGWVLENYRGHKLVHHGGNIDGFSAMVSLLPAERLGVIALTNLNGTFARDVIPYVVYDQVLGLEPLPWGQRFHEIHIAAETGQKEARKHADAKAQSAPPTHPLDDYAGTYVHPGYGPFTVAVEGDRLVPHYNNVSEFELVHRHYDVWDLKLELFNAVMPLTFLIDDAGDIDALKVPLEASVDPLVFARQPDPALSDPDRLLGLTGTFAMGPMRLRVEIDAAGVLSADLMRQRVTLRPHRGFVFRVAEQPGMKVEFDGDRVVIEGAGVFERVTDG